MTTPQSPGADSVEKIVAEFREFYRGYPDWWTPLVNRLESLSHTRDSGQGAAVASDLLKVAKDARDFLSHSVRIEGGAPDEQPGPASQWDWEADQIAHELTRQIDAAESTHPPAASGHAEVTEAAQSLVDKLRRIFSSLEYIGTFSFAQAHGLFYRGENCEAELKALEAALQSAQEKGK